MRTWPTSQYGSPLSFLPLEDKDFFDSFTFFGFLAFGIWTSCSSDPASLSSVLRLRLSFAIVGGGSDRYSYVISLNNSFCQLGLEFEYT